MGTGGWALGVKKIVQQTLHALEVQGVVYLNGSLAGCGGDQPVPEHIHAGSCRFNL